MRVTVELTYELSKLVGTDRFEVEDVATVKDLIDQARERVGPDFDQKTRLAAVVVNGVVASYQRGLGTRLADGDIVSFVKAAAGG
jgi:molybdopterin converting factor small subunit